MKCEICGKEYAGYNGFSQHVSRHLPHQEYYDQYLKTEEEGYCKHCGKPTNFKSLKLGYADFCPTTCAVQYSNTHQSEDQKRDRAAKVRQTDLDKYGVENVFQIDSIKETCKNSIL